MQILSKRHHEYDCILLQGVSLYGNLCGKFNFNINLKKITAKVYYLQVITDLHLCIEVCENINGKYAVVCFIDVSLSIISQTSMYGGLWYNWY